MLVLECVDAGSLLFQLELQADLFVLPILYACLLWPSGVLQFSPELFDDFVLPSDFVPQLLDQLWILAVIKVVILELSLQLQVLRLQLLEFKDAFPSSLCFRKSFVEQTLKLDDYFFLLPDCVLLAPGPLAKGPRLSL